MPESEVKDFQPGFRLSISDGLFIACTLLSGMFFYAEGYGLLTMVITMVVIHFFLFCNILRMARMARKAELVWAGFFLLVSIISVYTGLFSLGFAFCLSGILTLVLSILEIRKPSYHGVLWQRLNPDLEAWFNQH